MSYFSSILDKLGLGGVRAVVTDAAARISEAATPATQTATATPTTTQSATATSTAPVAVSPVDVAAKLEALAAEASQPLNWKHSIVDLLKLLGLDSSLAARKELATELGCPADKMSDSAQMNIWLHKAVLQRLAANGGHVPPELL